MSSLTNKVAIVSGAAQGLGLAFTHALADAGATVVALDTQAKPAALARANVEYQKADVCQRADMEQVVSNALDLGSIDVLINNAANWRPTPVTDSWQQALTDWDLITNTNIKGVMILSRLCVPHMQRQKSGLIVNVSSDQVLPAMGTATNPAEWDIYNASKWALNGFTDAWAKYLAKDNVRVNGLCVSPTNTALGQQTITANGLSRDTQLLEPAQVAKHLLTLIADPRSGENVLVNQDTTPNLGSRKSPHQRITG